MEKSFSIFFIGVIVVLSGCKNQTDWHRDGLNSKVKSVQQLEYIVENRFGEWQKTELENFGSHSLTEYDEDGMIISLTGLNNDLTLMYKNIRSYEYSTPIEETLYDEDGRKFQQRVIMGYSSDGWSFEDFDNDGNKIRIGQVLLENNRIARFTYNNIEDSSKYIIDYMHGDNGLVLEEHTMYRDNEEEHTFTTTYEYLSTDKKGNWLERLYFTDDDDNPLYMHVRTYEYY